MGLSGKLFGDKKEAGEGVSSEEDDRNPIYEKHLKNEFGLRRKKGDWSFTGSYMEIMSSVFSDPKLGLAILQGEGSGDRICTQVCIVDAGTRFLLVINLKPKPRCFENELDASGVADLISRIIKEGGTQEFTYHGASVFTLSDTPASYFDED